MKKTLVKTKIVLEDDGKMLTIYFWHKTFLFFGYWYPFGNSSSTHKVPDEDVSKINDNNVSKLLFEKFIR
jgi:hypothetical protein